MSVDLDLLHMLLIQNAEIGMPIRDLAFALGARETEVEVALINEGSSGHVTTENGRYFTLKKYFPKNISLRKEEECLIGLHQLLQSSSGGLLLGEIQERLSFDAEVVKDSVFAEKTMGRITFVSGESLAYTSTLEFPVENLVSRGYALQHQRSSPVSKWVVAGGILSVIVGTRSYFFL